MRRQICDSSTLLRWCEGDRRLLFSAFELSQLLAGTFMLQRAELVSASDFSPG